MLLQQCHNKYKRFEYKTLLNNKSLRHSMNRFQGKHDRIGTYEVNKISLSCFDDTMNMLDYLLVTRVNYKKTYYLNNYPEKLFCQAIKILF